MDEDSIFRHKDERKVRTLEDDASSVAESSATSNDQELDVSDGDSDSEHGTDQHEEEAAKQAESDKKESQSAQKMTEDDKDQTSSKTVNSQNPDDAKMDIESSNEKTDETDEKGENSEVVDSESSDEDESLFPDTSIQLQHVKGDKYVDYEVVHLLSSEASLSVKFCLRVTFSARVR